jgi:ATP-dependent RNA circularization protein (DNA/RNA ligase family)
VEETYNIRQQLKKLNRDLALQGEVIGPKIQGNIYKLPKLEFYLFLIYDLDKQAYVPYSELLALAAQLELTVVPIINVGAFIVNDIKNYVELSKGKSQINPNVLREGIVIRSLTENFSFKSINPEYLLKQE